MQKIDNISVLEQIGRLGLKTVKFDTGSGGVPFFKGCEFAGVLSGLNRLEMAWVGYAYLNTNDPSSLHYLVMSLCGSDEYKSEYEYVTCERIAELACKELAFRQKLSGRLRASVIGISKTSYFRKKDHYENLIDRFTKIICNIEKRAERKILNNLK